MNKQSTFENTYKNYTFAPLVAFGIWVASLITAEAKGDGAGSVPGTRKDPTASGPVGQAA